MEEKLNHIRALLQSYYEGTTSPAEEAEIAAFFLTATDVPADMEPDRRLFAALRADADDVAVPDGLRGSIDAMLRRKARRPRRNLLWISIVSSAAAVAIVATVVFKPQPVLQPSVESPAHTVMASVVEGPAESALAETDPAEEATAVAAATDAPRALRQSKVRKTPSAKPYREITDPDEALREAERALSRVSLSLRPVHRACAEVNENMEKIDEKLNKILK